MASRYRTEEDAVKDKKVSWREANIAGEKEFDWKGKDGKVTRIAVKLKEESKEDKQYYTPEDRKIIYPNLK